MEYKSKSKGKLFCIAFKEEDNQVIMMQSELDME